MKGFSVRNLKYMQAFAAAYPDEEFVQQVAAQLPWFHLCVLITRIKDPDERLFYLNKAIEHGWSRNVLTHQMELQLFHRQGKAITNFSHTLTPPTSDLARETLKDPYIFDFLTISDTVQEREIENALITHIQQFLLELGIGFAFLGRQYPIIVGNQDFYIDLLFYHTKLHCYVVIELKAHEFKPEYAGKLNFTSLLLMDSSDRKEIIQRSVCSFVGKKIKQSLSMLFRIFKNQ